ncbi:MAG: ornithine carbamoyltransferase [Candidatus Bathyarchaeia archaeon]|jgi:ornithine carbamoyltransferase
MAKVDLAGKDLITTQDWSLDELRATLKVARELKMKYRRGRVPPLLRNKTFFMLFYAPSTRTRAAFEAGMTYLGGHAQYIDVSTTRLGSGEAPKDVAKMYEKYGHGLGVRILDSAIDYVYGAGISVVREYAKHAEIPVINMACCTYHPTQGLADLMTVQESLGKVQGKKYVIMWGYAKSFRGRCSIQEEALIMPRFGMDVVLAHPPGFEIDPKIVETAKSNATEAGGSFQVSNDLKSAIEGAHAVFPRNWASSELLQVGASKFGKEREMELHEKYRNWTFNQDLLDRMDRKAVVTHVLPVLRGEEATDDVMDGPHSVIYPQAENGMYTKMAVLAVTMGRRKK